MNNAGEQEAQAMSLATTVMYSEDPDIKRVYEIQGIDNVWHLALSIVRNGPQTELHRRIVAEALVRRLEGK